MSPTISVPIFVTVCARIIFYDSGVCFTSRVVAPSELAATTHAFLSGKVTRAVLAFTRHNGRNFTLSVKLLK